MTDLNTLVDPGTGWILEDGRGINDRGQITGVGIHNGQEHAFLLSPTNFTWTGNGSDPRWSNGSNWVGGGAPVPTIDAAVTFTGSTQLNGPTQEIASQFQLNVLTFDSSAGAFHLNGGQLDFHNSSAGAPPTITNNSAATITIDSDLLLSDNTVYQGDGSMVVNGGVYFGGSFTKNGVGTLTLAHGANNTGDTIINAGTVIANGNSQGVSSVRIAASGTLRGSGSVKDITGPIGGGAAGLVSPGTSTSPSILTANSVAGGSGLSFAFELTQTGSPTYSNASDSGNDVLHLLGTTAFVGALDSSNFASSYLPGTVAPGQLFNGGFFANSDANFLADVSGAHYLFYAEVANGAALDATQFNGKWYQPLSDFGLSAAVGAVIEPSADFIDGAVFNGVESQVAIEAPEPSTFALLGIVSATLLVCGWRRRRVMSDDTPADILCVCPALHDRI
jgi:autotransporter-associated beta strand protein